MIWLFIASGGIGVILVVLSIMRLQVREMTPTNGKIISSLAMLVFGWIVTVLYFIQVFRR